MLGLTECASVGVDMPVVGDTVGDVLDGNNVGATDGLLASNVDGAEVGDTDADVGTMDGI